MKEIILQGQADQMRAALFEQGELAEVYEEEGLQARLVGNIYRGRVENVLPGMQAAFVDIGLDKNAFLYVGDAFPSHYDEEEKLSGAGSMRIEELLRPRQELVVQITKEPVGTKGARISTNLTIPGRYVVLLPKVDYIGVSRKITADDERARLHEIAKNSCPQGMGVIVRTLAQGVSEEEISEDLGEIIKIWRGIEGKLLHTSVPGLAHQDVNLMQRFVRDLIDDEVQKITVDEEEVAQILRQSLKELSHPAANHILLDPRGDLFERYGIDDEIKKALRPKVWLKNGGYLVIQQTEALTVIDVNTGKYIGQTSLAETVLNTNLEAAREIARQLRLRNIGGIIVIDFIDMTSEKDQKSVTEELEKGCLHDKIKCQVLGLTQLGLVEMTRKKVGQTLAVRYTKPCQACDGSGRVID